MSVPIHQIMFIVLVFYLVVRGFKLLWDARRGNEIDLVNRSVVVLFLSGIFM